MAIYKWICPSCRSAYILPRRTKHQHNHWRCYSCNKVFHRPREVGTMGMDESFYTPLMKPVPENWVKIVGEYSGPYEFPDPMMMYAERPLHPGRKEFSNPNRKRLRATVIAEQDGKVLLVRERGSRRYSLPGGGIERGESAMEAGVRELREETMLTALRAEFLFDHEGTTQYHKVIWALVQGRVQIQRKELSDHMWWAGHESVSLLDSAKAILERRAADMLGTAS